MNWYTAKDAAIDSLKTKRLPLKQVEEDIHEMLESVKLETQSGNREYSKWIPAEKYEDIRTSLRNLGYMIYIRDTKQTGFFKDVVSEIKIELKW